MLNPNSDKPAGQRKEYWEDLRKNHVPRFLFRAFSSESGGGPNLMINNASELVPHGFMHGQKGHQFYDMTESEIYNMVKKHFGTEKKGSSEFSSWAASLHLVLCFAHSIHMGSNPSIAILDRQALEPQVLIWHVPHFLGHGHGIHEYLAHGVIRGKGYTAVPLKELVDHGLYTVFPEVLENPKDDHWGNRLRYDMFHTALKVVSEDEAVAIKKIGSLFGDLSMPAKVALSCLRPRPWAFGQEIERLSNQTANQVIDMLDIEFLGDIASEPWLQPNAVVTERSRVFRPFLDVRNWIALLCIAIISSQKQKAKRKRIGQTEQEDIQHSESAKRPRTTQMRYPLRDVPSRREYRYYGT